MHILHSARVVAHCLALWSQHSGELSQDEKDFFDERVAKIRIDDEFVAVQELLAQRLCLAGFDAEKALELSHTLVAAYADGMGERIEPLEKIKH